MKSSVSERRWAENGKEIGRLRRRKGISQEKFAYQVGVTRRHMIRLENGEHLPSGELRDRICEALTVDRSEIRSADDEDDETVLDHLSVEDLLRALMVRVQVPV